jgi:hypothetical protein
MDHAANVQVRRMRIAHGPNDRELPVPLTSHDSPRFRFYVWGEYSLETSLVSVETEEAALVITGINGMETDQDEPSPHLAGTRRLASCR